MSNIAIKGNASGTGTFTVEAPNSNTDRTLVLPDEAGTVLTSASDLTGVTGAGGLFTSYAILWDQKDSATGGGTFNSGDWRTRDLNQEIDSDGIVTLSSNQFTLGAGTYLIRWSAPAFDCERHTTRLRNITDSTSDPGTAAYTDQSGAAQTRSFGISRKTISTSKTFEIQHRGAVTRANNGFGINIEFQDSIYAIVEIFKEA